MGVPITWQTIRGSSEPVLASRPLEQSRETISGAFDSFAKILQQREALDQNNVMAGQEAAKQAFLDQLAQAKNPEQLAALQASGALDAARQGLGLQARAAVRGADDARLTGLRQSQVAEQGYNDGQLDRSSMPIRNNIAENVAAGRFAEARDSVESSTSIRDKAPLLAQINAAEQAHVVQGRQAAEDAFRASLRPGELDKQAASTDALRAQAEAARAQAAQSEHTLRNADVAQARLEQEQRDAVRKRFIDNSPLAYGTLDSKTGMDAVQKHLTDNKITGDQHDDIQQQLSKYFPGGKMTIKDKDGNDVQVGVPVKAVLEAISASEGNPLERITPFWSRRGDDTHNRLKTLLDRPEFQKELANTLESLNMLPKSDNEQKLREAGRAALRGGK